MKCYNTKINAPVAQWIEHWPPEPCAQVRFLSGVPFCFLKEVMRFHLLLLIVNLFLTVITYFYYRFVFKAARGTLFLFLYGLLSVNVVVARMLPDVLPLQFSQTEAYLSGLWLGVLYYSFWVALLHFFVFVVLRCMHITVPKHVVGSVLMIFFFGLGCCGVWNVYHPVVRNERIVTEKLPKGTRFRIVMFSDVHLGWLLGRDFARSLVSLANAQKPDMVVVAGDLVDNSLKPVIRGNALQPLGDLWAPEGVYVVFGNHDFFDNPKGLQELLKEQHVNVLTGSSTTVLKGQVKLTGLVDCSRDMGTEALCQLAEANGRFYSIVVDHQPRRMPAAAEAGYDLYLAGHTHAGQMWPCRLFTRYIYDLDYGRKEYGGMTAIVSGGIGFWGPPIRSSTAPEIVVIDVEGACVRVEK